MTWTLFGLCQNLEAQRKLREEVLALPTDDPTMDELKALPYLDMVVRESLRLYTPLCVTMREATKDTALPMKDGSSIGCISLQCPNDQASRSGSDLSMSVRK
jgi:cytochrome P450